MKLLIGHITVYNINLALVVLVGRQKLLQVIMNLFSIHQAVLGYIRLQYKTYIIILELFHEPLNSVGNILSRTKLSNCQKVYVMLQF
jgi:hypothetical protein